MKSHYRFKQAGYSLRSQLNLAFAGKRSWAHGSSSPHFRRQVEFEMTKSISVVYVLVMIAVIVGVDLVFFRNRFWERLLVNIGVVLVFVAFYLRFFRNP